ncbi:MAG: hypothetical protein ACI33P_05735 [Lysinibacillus sp.]
MDIFELLMLIVLGMFTLYFLVLLFGKVIFFFRWLRMSPKEREKEKQRRMRGYSKSGSDSSDSFWDFLSFDSPSSDSGSDGGGSDGGGGGD